VPGCTIMTVVSRSSDRRGAEPSHDPRTRGTHLTAGLVLASLILTGCSRPPTAPDTADPRPAAASPAAEASARASFKFGSQTLSVPAGFTIELVAGPPLVNRPISIAFDEKGGLYATDSSGFSGRADAQAAQKPHRVVRLVDEDGDGRFENSTVFAENMMFPQGALFHEGSLYVAGPPEIVKLTDTDGDGVSDRRETWYDGKTLTGCANDLHGPYLGPEGWFYWTKGGFAEQRHTLESGRPFVSSAAHIFRSRPDGTGLEPMLTGGMDNPVGVTFTSAGDRFLCGTFFQAPAAGKRDGIIHSIYGGVYGKDQAAIGGHIRTGDLMPIMTHMGAAAPCGTTTYRSQRFGADFADNVFVCYFNLRKVSRHQLVPDGATYRTLDTDFVTSDSHDFHPTDVLEDADGSLLVVDTGGWYKICCPTSQLAKADVLGGIYRIRRNGAAKPEDPRGLKLPWTTLAADKLAELLADSRPDVQQRAVQLLGRQGLASVPALAASLTRAGSTLARQNALWALARIEGSAAREAVRTALADRETAVVRTAVQVAGLWRDAGAREPLQRLVAGSDAMLIGAAAEALGRIGDPRATGALLAAAGRVDGVTFTASGSPEAPAARVLDHALIYALIQLGAREQVRAALAPDAAPALVRAALVALDQMEGGGLRPEDVISRLDSPIPVVKQTAGWVVGHHAEWGEALSQYFRARLAGASPGDAEQSAVERQLAQLARAAPIQDLLAAIMSDAGATDTARLAALRAMSAAGLRETPARWLSSLAALLSQAALEPALARQAVATARGVSLPRGKHEAFTAALWRAGANTGLPADVRLDALAAAGAAASAVEPELFEFLCSHLEDRQPMLVRAAAAKVLSVARLAPPQQLELADAMRTVGPLEAPKLLPAFEKSPAEALGLRLVAALKSSPGLPGLRAGSVKALLDKYPAGVQREGEALLAILDRDAARQNAHVDELLAAAQSGDIRRGQVVFHSEKAACSLCHALGYLGGRMGPDLTRIGAIRNERELLEAIVYPSATFVRGYEPVIVTTRGGETHSGMIRSETAAEVVLATGPETELRVAPAEIAELRPGTVSPMPPGTASVLTPQELADLLVFLKALDK